MGARFTRKEFLARLNAKRAAGKPIIIGASGVGIIGKTADRAGIDIIMAYCTGPTRLNGNAGQLGYMAYVDSNGTSIEMGKKILDRVKDTPMVAGIGPADPYRDIDETIDELIELGFSGITNVPTVGGHEGALRTLLEQHGVGYNGEVELIRKCHEKDIFTIAYAFNVEETEAMVKAGADILCPHVGVTKDKAYTYESMTTVEQAAVKINAMKKAAKAINPEVFVACHGGPFADPESVQEGFKLTGAEAFVGASTVERIPVEKAIEEVVGEFSNLKLYLNR